MDSQDRAVVLKLQRRCGELIFNNGSRTANAYVEMSGLPEYDFLVSAAELELWSNGDQITHDEKAIILESFRAWADEANYKCQW